MTQHAVYLRLSKPKAGQVQTDDSIEAQRSVVHDFMRQRGVDPSDAQEFVDIVSAHQVSSANRPGFRAMVEQIEAGAVTTVWARHVDRLYRRVAEIDTLADLVERTGVTIEVAWGSKIDLNDAGSRTTARLLATVAQGEVETMSQRIRARLAANRAAGKARGGVRAFGWNPDGSLKEDEAELLRECLRMLIEGQTLVACVQMLKDAGATSPRGIPISHSTLSEMLRSPKLIGVTMHKRQEAGTGFYEPITDEQTYAAVQAIFNSPNRRGNRKGSGGRYPSNLLTNIAVCGLCEGTMQAVTGQDNKRRKDGQAPKTPLPRYRCKTGHLSISRPLLDSQAVAAMVRFWMNTDLDDLAPSPAAAAQMTTARADLGKIEAEREGIMSLLGQGAMSADEAGKVLAQLNERRKAATTRVEKLAESFTLATSLAPVLDGNRVDLGAVADLAAAFKAQPLERQRQQVARVWRPVVRHASEVTARSFVVGDTEHTEQVSGARKQERRTRWECLLNPNLTFDPILEDLQRAMESVAAQHDSDGYF